jgi:hypothetical protein
MKDGKPGKIVRMKNLSYTLISPPRSLPTANTTNPKFSEVGGLAEEVREVCQADPRQLEMLQVEETHAVIIHQWDILLVQVK